MSGAHGRGVTRAGPAVLLATQLLTAAGAGARPPDWPHLRGPGYDARVAALPADLAADEGWPRLLWKHELGEGYSGFIVIGDRIFTQTQSLGGQYLVSLDRETGERVWSTRYEPPWDAAGDWPGPYASPSYGDGRVCFAGCFGSVGCADAATGEILWQRDAKEELGGTGTEFGYALSPLIEGDLVILPIGGPQHSVVAFDLEDGSIRWASGGEAAGYTGSLAITVDGHRQVISSLATVLLAHDPATGAELWRHELRRGYNPHPAWPLFEGGYLFVPFAFRRGATVLRLSHRDGEARAEPVWDREVLSNDVFSSVAVDGFVYGFDIHDVQTSFRGPTKGELKCVELATGVERWSTGAVGGASIVSDGERLLLFTERGTLIVAEATPEAYREVARAPILPGELSWTPPAVHGDRVLVRAGRSAACLALGRAPEVAAATSVAPREPSVGELVELWIRAHHDRSFWAPRWGALGRWFGWSVLAVGLLAWLLAWPARAAPGVWRSLLLAEVVLLGAAGVPLLTDLTGRLVFTWPAALFALFTGLLALGMRAERLATRRSSWLARLAAVGFCLLCVGHDLACASMNLSAGRGFLFGFVVAWPVARAAVERLLDDRRRGAGLGLGLVAFALYFWSSALLYWWRAAGGS